MSLLPADAAPSTRPIAIWLLLVATLIFVMVVVGGLTRLTGSGLSIVEWRPLLGWLPPLSHAEWQEVFYQYRRYPEFRLVNPDMTLAGFKSIYWLEYIHRLLGRVIGLAFLIPFLFFVRMKPRRISRDLMPWLIALFVLGALQGALGWYMVQSGLVDQPEVSHYRLAAHLGLAVLIYAFMLRIGLSQLPPRPEDRVFPDYRGLRIYLRLIVGLIFVTIIAGALVAGLNAGKIYNTFPLMGGRLVPEGLLTLDPPHLNFFDNRVTVQFQHRILAIVTVLAVISFWIRAQVAVLPGRVKAVCTVFVLVALAQFGLGIATLMMLVPVSLAAAHQAGAMLLLTAAIWALHALRPRVYASSKAGMVDTLPPGWRPAT
ncbi:MAG: COX15/CtaA family protein [Pseudomonadota bacterium]